MTPNIENKLKDRCTIISIENKVVEKIGTLTQIEITNIKGKKIGVPSHVKTTNISGFQILEIISFEHILPDDSKTYIH